MIAARRRSIGYLPLGEEERISRAKSMQGRNRMNDRAWPGAVIDRGAECVAD